MFIIKLINDDSYCFKTLNSENVNAFLIRIKYNNNIYEYIIQLTEYYYSNFVPFTIL